MKKILPLLLLIVSFVHTGMSQKVFWGEEFSSPANKSLLQYIGHEEETYYFYYGYNRWTFSIRSKTVSLIAVKNGVVVAESEEFDVRDVSLKGIYLQGGLIRMIYSDYNKKKEVIEVFCKNIDAKTLVLQNDSFLLSLESEKKNIKTLFIRQSPDNSKMAIAYMDVHKRTRKGFLDIYIFDSQYNIITSTQFYTEMEGELNFLDFSLNDAGEFKMVGINNLYDYNLIQSQNFFVVTMSGETPITEKVVKSPNTYELKSWKAAFAKNGQLVVAGIYDENKMISYVFDMKTGKVVNQFSYSLEKNFAWNVSDIEALDNNSVVIVCEDAFTLARVDAATEYFFYNRSIRLVCIDPDKESPVYSKLITRATMSYNPRIPYSIWRFEEPLYFVKGNTFYALYNTSEKVDDFQDKPIKKVKTAFKKNNRKGITKLAAFDPDGKAIVSTLLSEKKDKAIFSPLGAIKIKDNQVVISKISKGKNMAIGTLSIE